MAGTGSGTGPKAKTTVKPNVKLLFPKKFDDSDDDAAGSSQQAPAASASPASVGDCYRATKAPWDHKHRTATEHSLAGSRMLDAEIVLRKDPETDPRAARIKTHHNRAPDVGIGILISIPCYRAGRDAPEMIEYSGRYLGHGKSKTAFELNHPGAKFHGNVLKVAKAYDMEPSVFRKAAPLGLATHIHYNCEGRDADSGHRFHCWITDRTIPLDELCRDENANQARCSLAAFCCMLRAAQHGFYLSDCHFFNFGVTIDDTENATEHLVVIIDAGSRGIHSETQWPKSEVNVKVMHKFWKHCDEYSASCSWLKELWRWSDINNCLQRATAEWQCWPFLTDVPENTSAILQAMSVKDSFRRSTAHSKSAYKMMELVGRFTAEDQWSSACFWECYRASEKLQSEELHSEEYNILDELYSRITTSRARDEELHNVMMFWGRLNEYREQECRRMWWSTEDQAVTQEQATNILENFKYFQLWYELTPEQRWSNPRSQHSTLNTILNKKAGWTHAAKAIMQYGLPKLEQPAQPDDATEHINALGQFARDMAKWLVSFASSMHAYRQTPEYQKKYQASIEALEKRTSRPSESQSTRELLQSTREQALRTRR